MSGELADPTRAQTGLDLLWLRLSGVPYPVLSQRTGLAAPTIDELIREALAAIPDESREQLRKMQMMRIDTLLHAAWPTAMGGDLKAISVAADLLRRHAALSGLDAPVRVEVSDKLDSEIEKLIASLAAQRDEHAER